MGLLSGLAGLGVGAVFDAASQWVASGAVWVLGQVAGVMSATTEPPVKTGWFESHFTFMAATAVAVMVPMLCAGAIQAVLRQSPSMLVRAFLVQLPLAVLLTAVALTLVGMGLDVTDTLSRQVLASAGGDTTHVIGAVTAFLSVGSLSTGPAVPTFVVFLGALVVALASLGLWLELVVRSAAVSVAVLFLPLALAGLVWPAVSHWPRRLADTLVALVLSKFVIAAVLALAASAIAGGLDLDGSKAGGGFGAVVAGIAMLIVATTAPFTLLKLVPALEAGAIAHLEGARHRLRHTAMAPQRAGGVAWDLMEDANAVMAGMGTGAASAGAAGAGAGARAGGVGASAAAAAGATGVTGGAPSGRGRGGGRGGSSAGGGVGTGSGTGSGIGSASGLPEGVGPVGDGPGPDGSPIGWWTGGPPVNISPEWNARMVLAGAGVPQKDSDEAVAAYLAGEPIDQWLPPGAPGLHLREDGRPLGWMDPSDPTPRSPVDGSTGSGDRINWDQMMEDLGLNGPGSGGGTHG